MFRGIAVYRNTATPLSRFHRYFGNKYTLVEFSTKVSIILNLPQNQNPHELTIDLSI